MAPSGRMASLRDFAAISTMKGPAKYYVGETPFELSRRSEMRMSEAIRRGVRPDGPSLYDKALRD